MWYLYIIFGQAHIVVLHLIVLRIYYLSTVVKLEYQNYVIVRTAGKISLLHGKIVCLSTINIRAVWQPSATLGE